MMDEKLAMQLGADIYGAIPDVFVNADGYKKSVSSPGAGNYITVAKAVAAARSVFGKEVVRERSFIQAHGSSTPLNRTTESIIFDKVAANFGIKNWPVTAVKAFMGHSIGPASGDQLSSALGTFSENIISGIKTVDSVAEDVYQDNLDIVLKDKKAKMDIAFLNSKGFGGNNATAWVASPDLVDGMLQNRYSQAEYQDYVKRRETTRSVAKEYDQRASQGDLSTIYNFGQGVLQDKDIKMSENILEIEGFNHSIQLDMPNPYEDMTKV